MLAAHLAMREQAEQDMAADASAWIKGYGIDVSFIWSGICLCFHQQLALAHELQNSSGSNDRNSWSADEAAMEALKSRKACSREPLFRRSRVA